MTGGTISGQCLCGAVKFFAGVKSHDVDACHCSMCRRWSSGPFIALSHDGKVTFEGTENISIYKSSDWGERAFCKSCGTSLYWRLSGSDHYAFSAGTLDDQAALKLTSQIFIDEKPDYYDFVNDTPRLTGAEAIAAFMAKRTTE